MHDYEKLVAFTALVGATIFLSTRPARGPGSIDASPLLQAAVIASSLAWGMLSCLTTLLVLSLVVLGHKPDFWPSVVVGLATSALCLAWLARPWGRIFEDTSDERDCHGIPGAGPMANRAQAAYPFHANAASGDLE